MENVTYKYNIKDFRVFSFNNNQSISMRFYNGDKAYIVSITNDGHSVINIHTQEIDYEKDSFISKFKSGSSPYFSEVNIYNMNNLPMLSDIVDIDTILKKILSTHMNTIIDFFNGVQTKEYIEKEFKEIIEDLK